MKNIFVSICFLLVAGISGSAAIPTISTEANVPVEITLVATKSHADPFNSIRVDVLFTNPQGATKLVPAFWDGGNVWKARYSSAMTGKHRWRAQCNDTRDSGLNGVEGNLTVTVYRGDNPLFKHGQIQVAPDKRHLQHADGTPFFWLGDTWWMGLCHRIHFPEEFSQLAADRKQKGFNVIQIVAGLYPDMFPFDPRGANEDGFPWTTNYTSIRPEYFDAADRRIRYLVEQGFTPCIVGAWGYFLPMMGEARMKQHWRELIARYGAWPVVWCVAGEANLPWYLAKNFPYDDREQVRDWTEIARYIRATDPFHRLTTIHPTGIGKLNARWAIDDASLIDFDMLQTPHGEANAVAPTLAAMNHAYQLPPMPVINGEPAYENLNGQIEAQWPRAMFWFCMLNGAAGHTYGANGIWQCNRRGEPHGPSPHHKDPNGYGTIPWDDAMHLPGSKQIGDAKKFLEKFAWQRCSPMPESVASEKSSDPNWHDWIWYPEGDPREDAPLASRFFRREFILRDNAKIKSAVLHVVADDKAVIWLNGRKLGEAVGSRTPHQFNLAVKLRSGKNVLAFQAENQPAPVKLNPAGLLTALEILSEDSDAPINGVEGWRATKEVQPGWQAIDFNDTQWPPAKLIAKYGEGPWEKIEGNEASFAPVAMGEGERLRIVYSLSPSALTVSKLRPGGLYEVSEFDPVSGAVQKETKRADDRGMLQFPPPANRHDRAIALQLKN